MPAAQFGMLIEQGTDWEQECAYIDGNGDPVNLTGGTLAMQIRNPITANTTLANLTIGNGITVTNSTLGQFTLSIGNLTTSNLPAGTAVYDLEFKPASGLKERMIQGYIIIDGEVTR